jgi:hypothetical protein
MRKLEKQGAGKDADLRGCRPSKSAVAIGLVACELFVNIHKDVRDLNFLRA